MPASNIFVETYLREIGVQTPVSLLSLQPETAIAPQAELSPAVSMPPVPEPLPAAPAAEAAPVVFKTLDEIAVTASTCRLCSLADARTQVVFGVGNPHADLVFIGEAPGRDEDLQGEPFVGMAGQLLDRMLAAIGLDRDAVYIMNTVKCRPPNNRDPRAEEVKACNLWFEQQLEALQPKMICVLGRVAAQTLLQTDANLGALRGQWHDYQGIPVWVTYHPAYLLRSPQQKQKGWQDLCLLADRYRDLTQT
ncbi:MAG: uracil-DNA glycosylase [Zetaproteobacteria bacterium CG12_big_fil_rev_8_21_14_0_65_54_13]|nr:MAG: uracil-DNA glycosylase [Zetaproteobacteria bacterium CG23_combo_of_CG06-09_8_20_14_all_54_7]PIW49185.1 MAG: uracil-DNA glycosylase [Zetaproteobacteria bacterium CG12_big_fil_rev_8_21_14_0_65_54_13]PIX54808.1 MAG: uracil-DNA glycosylase [Zetaproteobacteria bacterium CG_4_10_14_3_um_filter_54_28]